MSINSVITVIKEYTYHIIKIKSMANAVLMVIYLTKSKVYDFN
jgi:hypothetical protein